MSTIIITSVIHPTNNPLNYTPTRSVFDVDSRLKQTIETIMSIKKMLPTFKVVLADCSAFDWISVNGDEIRKVLGDKDEFIDLSSSAEVAKWVHSPNKSAGEAFILHEVVSTLESLNEDIYKISGRYVIDSSFNIERFDMSRDFNVRVIYNTPWEGSTSIPSFYRASCREKYMDFLNYAKNRYTSGERTSMEKLVYDYVTTLKPSQYQFFDSPIGIKGRIAVHGNEEIH